MPELPAAWKGYVLTNQIRGKVWLTFHSKEAWINLGRRQGVLPGMILFCYDPKRATPYVRVPEVTVVDVLDERSRVVPADGGFTGLLEGLIVASGQIR